MKKVLCIGHAAYDITMHIPKFPNEDYKYHVNEIIECGGGPACNAAALLGMWGVESYFAGTVGNDTYGNIIEEELIKANVNVDCLRKLDNVKTPNSFILINEENGSRTLFNYTSKDLKLGECDIDFKPDLILIDGYDYDFVKKTLLENKDVNSIMDGGNYNKETFELAHLVNWLVCSKGFVESYIGKKINVNNNDELVEVFNKMKLEFKNNIVITLGEYGSLYEKDGQVHKMGIYKVEPVDTTGAGDIFHGAFAYSLVNNYDIDKAIKISSITAALSVKTYGGRYSIRSLEEVMEIYNE